MELLRQLSNFTTSVNDKTHIYKTYIRSVLEQSCVVWNSNLTKQNKKELERVQKVAVKLITNKNKSYKEALTQLKLPTLEERREELSAKFANKCLKNSKTKHMFTENMKTHQMKLRKIEKYKIQHVKTARTEKSAIPNMTRHINRKHEEHKRIFTLG